MTTSTLPHIVRCTQPIEAHDFGAFVAGRQREIDDALHACGAVLFSGFGIASAEAFSRCLGSLPIALQDYVDGNSPRRKIKGRVYTASEYHAELPISLHNELSYAHEWPGRIYFCCVLPATSGGSTTLADGRKILGRLSPGLLATFRNKGVTYVRNLPSAAGHGFGKTWEDTFETTDRGSVERHCAAAEISCQWRADGSLQLVHTRPATTRHPKTGEEVWFNQAEQFHPSSNPPDIYEALSSLYEDTPFDMPHYACFGDGTPIPLDALAEIRSAMAANLVDVRWEKGDFLIVDNVLAAHGRAPFQGQREVLVSMSA